MKKIGRERDAGAWVERDEKDRKREGRRSVDRMSFQGAVLHE